MLKNSAEMLINSAEMLLNSAENALKQSGCLGQVPQALQWLGHLPR